MFRAPLCIEDHVCSPTAKLSARRWLWLWAEISSYAALLQQKNKHGEHRGGRERDPEIRTILARK